MGDFYSIGFLAAVCVMVLLGLRALSGGAKLSHEETLVRQPGQIAVELGLTLAEKETRLWRLWFDDARIRYTAAERAWSAQYRRASHRRKKRMLQERLAMQADISSYIDPVGCLQHLAKIAEAGALTAMRNPPAQAEPRTVESDTRDVVP